MAIWHTNNPGGDLDPPPPTLPPDPTGKVINDKSWELSAIDGWFDTTTPPAPPQLPGKQILTQTWDLTASGGWYDSRPLAGSGELQPLYAWPNTTVFYMTTDNTAAIKNGGTPTPLTNMMKRTPIAMMQGGDMFTQSQRNASVPFWTDLNQSSVPGQVLVNHRFAKTTKSLDRPGAANQGDIAWRAIFVEQIPNAHLTRGSGNWIGSENDPAYWLVNYSPTYGAGAFMAEEHVVIHQELAANGVQVQIYYDGWPNIEADRRAQQLHGGEGEQIISIPATGQVTVPYWNINLSGLPDVGSGFSDVSSLYSGKWPSLRYINAVGSNASTGGGKITGVKHNGTSSTVIRFNTGQVTTADYPQVGATFAVMDQNRVGYDQDFNNDGVDESRTDAGMKVRENAKIEYMELQSQRMEALLGYKGWVCCNGLSTSGSLKWNQVNSTVADDPSYDKYDWVSGESMNNSMRWDAYEDNGIEWGMNLKLFDLDKFMFSIYYGREWLKLDTFDQDTGVWRNARHPYPFVLPACELGVPQRATGSNDWTDWINYSNPNYPDARMLVAAARFFWGISKTNSHVLTSLSGKQNSRDPWVIEEHYYDLGRPLDEANRTVGTFNRAVAGPSAYAWKTAHFGTRGYVAEFEKGAVAVNYDVPTVANGALETVGSDEHWRPRWGSSGATINWANFAPVGKVARKPNSATYTCVGQSPTDPRSGFQPGQSLYCGKDPLTNNGQLVTTEQIGPCEVSVVFWEDA